MAHKGVLFLDEMPEFNRKTLEVLRQPLEEGKVTISRALNSSTFPADFILVAAMNPCPCGYRSDPRRACSCTPPQVEKYLSRISGPLLDRIDLHVEVPAVPFTQLAEMPPGAPSSEFRAQVLDGPRAADQAVRRDRPRLGRQRPDDPAPGPHDLQAQARGAEHPQGRDGGTRPLGPSPRQGPPRRPHDRRPGRLATRSSPSTSPRRWDTARSTGASGCENLGGRYVYPCDRDSMSGQ